MRSAFSVEGRGAHQICSACRHQRILLFRRAARRPWKGATHLAAADFDNNNLDTLDSSSNTVSARVALLDDLGGPRSVDISKESVTTQPLATSYHVLKFNGAPEKVRCVYKSAAQTPQHWLDICASKVNGRLAMLGFLLGAIQEAKTGQTLQQQFTSSPVPTLLLVAVFTYATLVPMTKGAKAEAFGIFTPMAEAVNGRAAMLGFGVLLCLEWKAGVPFF